jgi:alpha-beta hydrolase superfamily lysophospholipase
VERSIVRRTESQFEGEGGRVLFRRAWQPPEPTRLLVVLHGYAEHSGRYDPFGAWFAARGFAVHAYDQQGHGRSGGRRCHVDAWNHLLDDLDGFLERVRAEHPALPLVLVGHSFGGLVVTSYLAERKPAIAAAVTSGAALRISERLPGTRRLMVRALRRVAPFFTLESGLDVNGLSRDPAVVRAYVEDPLVHRRMTLSFASEFLRAMEQVRTRAREVTVPMLLLHGDSDPLCPVEGSRAFHAELTDPASRLRVYRGLRHEIFNEPEREQVWQDIIDWLEKPESQRG